MAAKRIVRLWAGIGFGLEKRHNRYGKHEFYLVLPFIKLRITKSNYYFL